MLDELYYILNEPTMKHICLILVFILCGILLYAQGYKKRTPEEKARKYTDELKAVIELDSISEQKIFHVNLNVSKQFDSLYANKPEQNEMRKAYAIIFKTRDAAYKEIMTKQQFLIYDDWQREQREKKQKEKQEKNERIEKSKL